MNVLVFFSALLLSCSVELAHSFSSTSLRNQYRCALHRKSVARTVAVFLPQQTVTTSLYLSKDREYSREIRLREEAESPFRKVRFFLYAAILGGAFTSLAVSIARIAAGLSGVNTGLLEESTTNAAIDIGGIALFGFLFKRDADAQESRLKRAAKGAEFAKLAIRGSPALLDGAEGAASGQLAGKTAVTATLSSLRRGRGVDKRVVIAAAGKDTIREVLEEAALAEPLVLNDLVIVPVVYPQGTAPLGLDVDLLEQDCVALPAGGNWKAVINDEASEAVRQGVDITGEGFCIVLKKNGRVGQRTKGIYLDRMVGEVNERRAAGMDVSNI
eukprot:CAMPEP_0113560370 /NCGR_PEP_ID=MMETSP0015_2-20120614/19395_1 /TAXON_ID=2838 /ORGANISM="Odontella" /LENGTH=328 /DNA_ID=CAMNT_0000462071 /DNA_START=118 /DNA_END=1105 /DNA_ORIENTATION=+ /assembly_acc=CAM_ASM_000160